MQATVSMQEQWSRSGYLAPVPVLSSSEIDQARQQFESLESRMGIQQTQIELLDRHLDMRFVWDLATHPKLLDAVEQVIGSDILLMSTQFFCKYPSREAGEAYVAWHQDVTYWGLEPPLAVTAWLALDDTDVANGCMRVIPESHRDGILDHGKAEAPGNLLSINQAIDPKRIDDSSAVDVVLKKGQMSLHDGLLIHGSNPNRSNRRRCGLTARFLPPQVRQVQADSRGGFPKVVLVRGKDKYSHFDHVAAPF